MSSWSEISFFVVGDILKIKELEQALPSLFHMVLEKDRIGGALMAQVAQNYGAAAAMEFAIERYPDLNFNGVQVHEAACDRYWVFSATQGETKWDEFSLPGDFRPMTASEIQDEISRIDEKMACLSKDRDFYEGEIRKAEAKFNTGNDDPGGHPNSAATSGMVGKEAPAVAAIIARIKGK